MLVGGAAVLVWANKAPPASVLTITNQSRQAIDLLQVTVGGQVSSFKDVGAGAEVAAPVPAKGDVRFTVDGRLKDGTVIRGQGMFVEGLNVIVQPAGGIAFRQAGKG